MTRFRPKRLSRPEFIALMAMMFATIAFSIDAMLPALPEIAQQLTPFDLNRSQLVLTGFLFGMGIGTLFTGPLSDSFGRRKVLLWGMAIYAAGAILGATAKSFEVLLAARVLQGLGAAGPRVVAVAIIRDLYAGRQMAQLMSFVMMVFTLVPAIAPGMGAIIIHFAGWRGVFFAFVAFAAIGAVWVSLRQAETLPPEKRRPLHMGTIRAGMTEVLKNRTVLTSIGVQSLVLGALFGMLSSTQQIFDITFDQRANFPLWYAGIALVAGSASFVNARLVVRLGMRRMVRSALIFQLVMSFVMALGLSFDLFSDWAAFPAFLIWMTSVFFILGLTLGNLNAIAMEPMGHIAGMTASVVGAVSTVLAVSIAAPMGFAFDGTPLPLAIGIFMCILLALGLMQFIRHEPVQNLA